MSAVSAIVERLTAWGLTRCDTLDALIALDTTDAAAARAATTAGFVERPTFEVEEHFDISAGVFVYDPHLGTLGLVEVLETDEPARLGRVIEDAAYLRQLCLLQAERTTTANVAESRALTVELVLVFPRSVSGDAAVTASEMLRTFVRDTGYLRSLGVSLLHERPDGGFDDRDLRRAFAWLLVDVRKWFGSRRLAPDPRPAATDAASDDAAAGPWSITLTNYRHHGVRTYQFDGRAAFHVLHGYNGAGKSTLSEAFELVLTESIERLDQANQQKYFPVVRFRRRQLPGGAPPVADEETSDALIEVLEGETAIARVRVMHTAADDSGRDRERTWLAAPSDWHGVAASFRLDQRLMDIIVHSPEATRAELFLKAYFPAEAPKFAERALAAAAADQAVALVPAAIRSRVPTGVDNPQQALRAELCWTRVRPVRWRDGVLPTLEPCLPISVAQLRLVSRVNETLGAVLQRFEGDAAALQDVATELASLDEALAGIAGVRGLVPDLECAIALFDEFEAWQPVSAGGSQHPFQHALDEWLDLQASADLASKHYDVAATLAAARAAGWHGVADQFDWFETITPTAAEVAELRAARDRLAEERTKARHRVDELSNRRQAKRASPAAASQVQPSRRFLKPDEQAALTRVGPLLPSLHASATAPFGAVFAAALKENSRSGLPTTFAPARAEAEALRAACAALAAAKPNARGAFEACRTAFRHLARLARLDRAIQSSFFMQLRRGEQGGPLLNNALNELLALFKPAPWAYADISLQAGGSASQSQELRIATADEGRADLRLNTAEMNAFALSLCLLCAPTLDNPLRLVLLDDPLQNMDEMTVAAVARGLGRLIRVYPRGWRIVALFHSEEDLRRLQEEVPTAVYRLPWVTAAPVGDGRMIVAERSYDTVPRLQRLRELLYVPEAAGERGPA